MVSTQDTSLRRESQATANQRIELPDFVIKGAPVEFYAAIEEGHNTVHELTKYLGLTNPGDAGYHLSLLKEVGFIEHDGKEYTTTGRAVKEVSGDSELVLRGSLSPRTRLAALYTAIAQGCDTIPELTKQIGLRDPSAVGFHLSVLKNGLEVIERAGKQKYRIKGITDALETRKTPQGMRRDRTKSAKAGVSQTAASEFRVAAVEPPAAEISREPVLTIDEVLEYMARLSRRLSEMLPRPRINSFEGYILTFAAYDDSPDRVGTLHEIGNTLEKRLDEGNVEQFLAGLEVTDPGDVSSAAKYLDSWKNVAPMESSIPDSQRLLLYLGISPELDECVKIFKNIMAKLPEDQAKRVGSLFFGIMPDDNKTVETVHLNAVYRVGHALEGHIDRREYPEPLIRHLEAIDKIDPAGIETYMHEFSRLKKSRAVPVNMTSGVAYPAQGIADFRRMVEIRYNKMEMRVPSAVDEGILTLSNLPQNYQRAFLRIARRKNYPVQKAVAFASELAGKDVRRAADVISKYTIG